MSKSLAPVMAGEGDKEDDSEPDEWKVKGAADDLLRAEEHKRKPKLMKHVMKHLKGRKEAIDSIQGLRDEYKKKYPDGSD